MVREVSGMSAASEASGGVASPSSAASEPIFPSVIATAGGTAALLFFATSEARIVCGFVRGHRIGSGTRYLLGQANTFMSFRGAAWAIQPYSMAGGSQNYAELK